MQKLNLIIFFIISIISICCESKRVENKEKITGSFLLISHLYLFNILTYNDLLHIINYLYIDNDNYDYILNSYNLLVLSFVKIVLKYNHHNYVYLLFYSY